MPDGPVRNHWTALQYLLGLSADEKLAQSVVGTKSSGKPSWSALALMAAGRLLVENFGSHPRHERPSGADGPSKRLDTRVHRRSRRRKRLQEPRSQLRVPLANRWQRA
jgi:hypothetical protein